MPIKYIFNGYYRSGTTLLWEMLKKSNPGYIVFYEPLHPNLEEFIKKEAGYKNELHNKHLWTEYFDQGNEFINKLSIYKRPLFPNNDNDLLNYLDEFNKLDANIILQTNRLQFHLKIIKERYDVEIVQIIRNPIDVYNSLLQIYNKKTLRYEIKLKRILSYLKNIESPKTKIFYINKILDFTYENYGIPNCFQNIIKKKFLLCNSFESHKIAWILSNYFPILMHSKGEIHLILYENLVSDNLNNIENIFRRLKLNIDFSLIKKTDADYNKYILNYKFSDKKLNDYYKFILEEIKELMISKRK